MLTKTPQPRAGFQIERLDGEIVLFHPASTTIIHSNESGALLWQLCDGARTVAEITAILSAAWPDAAASIAADVANTLLAFAEHGALELL